MSRNNIETIDSSLSQDPACASLLPKSDNDERFNNNLFGQFKGFTLTPLPNPLESTNQNSLQSTIQKPLLPATINQKFLDPTKPAPLPPTIPTIVIKTNIKSAQRSSALRSAFMSQPLSSASLNDNDHIDGAPPPALPPSNPGSNSRPLISSPVLATTTCTSMELIVGAKIPTRPAPEVPVRPPETLTASSASLQSQKPSRPSSVIEIDAKKLEKIKKIEKDSNKPTTLNRIASMLRPSGLVRSISQPVKSDKFDNTSVQQQQHQKVNKIIDKELLRNLQISNPIPQKNIEISAPVVAIGDSGAVGERKNVVMRAQSMRDTKMSGKKPLIQSFGSMRVPNGGKRPVSIPTSARPTSPPPPVPPPSAAVNSTDKATDRHKIPGLPGYQTPQVKVAQKIEENTYDDCMNLAREASLTKIMEESPSHDNIYAVIEEPVSKGKQNICATNEYKVPKPIETSGGSSDGMGLLSEIVSEISNRNFDSIYSASTLDRKKKKKEKLDNLGSDSSLGTYANTGHYKSPESVYSNSPSAKFNSAVSETSSGYLLPSAVNVPRLDEMSAVSNSQKSSVVNIQKSQVTNSPKTPVTSPQKSPVKAKQKDISVNKLESLKSKNPNVNDELSKVLGMKPPESPTKQPVSSVLSRQNVAKKDIASKPPLSRTKTPPHITKNLNKDDNDVKTPKTVRQGSDTSLKSNKSQSSKDRRDSTGSTSKIVPSTTSKNKNNNSPDVVSSCSTNSPTSGSPDVLGNSAKLINKNIQQKTTPVTAKFNKNPIMPVKPSSIVTKTAIFNERKKSPTTNITKSLSTNLKDDNNKLSQTTKNDAKINTEKLLTGNKTNVATLQKKFELQNKTGTINSVKNNVIRKTSIDKTNSNLKK